MIMKKNNEDTKKTNLTLREWLYLALKGVASGFLLVFATDTIYPESAAFQIPPVWLLPTFLALVAFHRLPFFFKSLFPNLNSKP